MWHAPHRHGSEGIEIIFVVKLRSLLRAADRAAGLGREKAAPAQDSHHLVGFLALRHRKAVVAGIAMVARGRKLPERNVRRQILRMIAGRPEARNIMEEGKGRLGHVH